MKKLTLKKDQIKQGAVKLQNYVMENFDVEIGGLEAEVFVGYITENLGKYYYDQGIADAQGYIGEKVEEMFFLLQDEKE